MNHQNRYCNINSTAKALALMLVVLLTLLASCTVRHAIQTQLQVPITKSLNATKAAVNTSTLCQAIPELAAKSNSNSSTHQELSFPALLSEAHHLIPFIAGSSQKLLVAEWHWTGAIPLYILYRKMRVLS